jgi:tRNA(Ile)-lysidine synthase
LTELTGPASFQEEFPSAPQCVASVAQAPPDADATERDMPLSQTEFADAMAALGPFEREPALAVAVSGGADSLALCLLAYRWAQDRKGSVIALTVDHRLRSDSTSEAEQVGEWLKAHTIDHRILPWCGTKPKTAIQENARRARYALLTRWCREAGVLHLLLGHHRRDQAETVAMRMSRGSGEAGLAAMAGVVEMPAVRLLRPLLKTPPARLRAFLAARGQQWVEDPLNRDPRFTRTAVRNVLTVQATTETALSRLAARMARKRVSRDGAVARVVVDCVSFHPAGFAVIDAARLAAAPRPVGLAALQNVVACVGGGAYPPALAKIQRIFARVIMCPEAAGGNLGGCRVFWLNRHILVCREARNLPEPFSVQPDEVLMWDQRFLIRFTSTRDGDAAPAWIRPLRKVELRWLAAMCPHISHHRIPEAARAALPALLDEAGVFSVPHLGYRREGGRMPIVDFANVEFRPANPLAGAGCFLAYAGWGIM